MSTGTAIDLFAGAGGLSEGFKQAGYKILAANDFEKFAAETYKATHQDTQFIDGSIQDIKASDFLKAAGIKKGDLDCLIGGPPCQAYSVYNHQRGMHDERSGLFREYLRIVEGIFPKWVVIENVTGITSIEDGLAVNEIKNSLHKLGYTKLSHKIINSEDYGVPQQRRRIVFIANRINREIFWKPPTHDGEKIPFVTVSDAIGDLPTLKNGEGEEVQPYQIPFKECEPYQKLMRKYSKEVYNHVAPTLSDVNLSRMKHIPVGGSWRDIPFNLLPAGMKKAKRSDHTKRYGRLDPNGLSSTILTKCDIHWGAYIHPSQDRTITVREAARLQSFPDTFKFQGPKTEQYRQVGNAVPPLMGKAIAESLSLVKTKERQMSFAI